MSVYMLCLACVAFRTSNRAASAQRRQEMSAPSKTRLKKNVHEVFSNVVEDWASRTHLPVTDVGLTAADLLLKHEVVKEVVQSKIDSERKRKRGDGAIGESLRPIWAYLSRPDILASNFGWQSRRMILGCVCGPSTTYAEAVAFLGGHLSREFFLATKNRRIDAIDYDDITLL